jgi:hypothetical protein
MAQVQPVINTFTASPEEITSGNSATLTWNVSNASAVTITPLSEM